MYVYVHVYVYVYVHVHVYDTFMYVYVHAYVYVYVHVHVYINVYIYIPCQVSFPFKEAGFFYCSSSLPISHLPRTKKSDFPLTKTLSAKPLNRIQIYFPLTNMFSADKYPPRKTREHSGRASKWVWCTVEQDTPRRI